MCANFSVDYEIYVMNADGTNPIKLVPNIANETGPVWAKPKSFGTNNPGTVTTRAPPIP